MALVGISGTYGTVTGVIEGTFDGTNFIGLPAVALATEANATGTLSPGDNGTVVWKVRHVEGMSQVRFRQTTPA